MRTNVKVGDYIRIRRMEGEPRYTDRIGKVEFIDDADQIDGTWGGCSLIPGTDEFEVISEARYELYKLCDETNTKRSGMDFLVDYYVSSLKWTEEDACRYALGLFKNGTIQAIKILGKDGKEI